MEVRSHKTLPFAPIYLVPLGDIQAGTEACDLDLLDRTVQESLRLDAPCFYTGMGDYLDIASPSNRKAWQQAGFYDSVEDMMDDRVGQEEKQLLSILKPTTGKWLGMLTGHHWWKYQDGTNSDERLAKALETEHLGTCAMVRLPFSDLGVEISCTIWSHHGVGSSSTAAGALNRLEKVANWAEADIYLMGHQHRRVAIHLPRLYITDTADPLLLHKSKLLACTGSYLKGYLQGSRRGNMAQGTYVEAGMLPPVQLGSLTIKIKPVWLKDHAEIHTSVMT